MQLHSVPQWFYLGYQRGWGNDKFARDYWVAAEAVERGKIPVDHPEFDKLSTGFHFDAVLFANWLRDNYAKPRGVKHIKKNLKKKPKADLVFDFGDRCIRIYWLKEYRGLYSNYGCD